MKRYTILLLIVVLSALLMASAGGAAAEPAAVASFIPGEPNDTFAAAIPLPAQDAQIKSYFLTAADLDYYRVELPTAAHLYINLYADFPYGTTTTLTAELAVYDAAQTLIAQDTDCDADVEMEVDAPPGGVYLRARPCAGTLDVDVPYSLYAYFEAREWEPNNTRPTANDLYADDGTVRCDYCQTYGAVNPAGDTDFFRFAGQAGRWISLEAYSGVMNLEMVLQAADGSTLATGANGDAGEIVFQLPADATYYLRVRSATHPTGAGNYTIYLWRGHVAGDVEPNDTPAQAVPAVYGQALGGDITDTDVDYYRFSGQAGDEVALPLRDVTFRWNAQLALYDPTMNAVALNGGYYLDTYWVTLPVSGVYTLKVFNPEAIYGEMYGFTLLLTGGDEPNNTRQTATDVTLGPVLAVTHDYMCDTDWFRFQGRAGDVLAGVNTQLALENVFLYDANGVDVGGHVLPADGTYYLQVLGYASDKEDTYCDEGPVNYPFGEALWVSAAVDGLGGGAAIKRGDIATRKTAAGQWQIVFDASDVGITANLAAFERLPNGSILMSLGGTQNVPGLGKVTPQDIIRFVPTALGDTTAGAFTWFLDGSDVGLSTSGEKIDAISMQRDVENPLRISISGAGSVPRQSGGNLKVADEDVINFVATAYGADSAGKWRVYLDGSTVPGMATEDVSGMTRVEVFPQRDSPTLLSFDSAFTISGQSGGPFDVLTEGSWRPAVVRLTDKKLDGLSVGAAWTP